MLVLFSILFSERTWTPSSLVPSASLDCKTEACCHLRFFLFFVFFPLEVLYPRQPTSLAIVHWISWSPIMRRKPHVIWIGKPQCKELFTIMECWGIGSQEVKDNSKEHRKRWYKEQPLPLELRWTLKKRFLPPPSHRGQDSDLLRKDVVAVAQWLAKKSHWGAALVELARN